MEFNIRFAEPKDVDAILGLIQELADFEKEPDAVEIDSKYLLKHGFGEQPAFLCYVAEDNNKNILGMALFYHRFSTWKGLTFHLEDLIVKQEFRKLGIGKALFEAFLKHAKAKKVNRAEWVVLDWNVDAVEFYKSYGAHILDDWKTVQMDRKTIQNLK
jgi:ribosomal protein S18 acetylase RimI-like enzyme